jgi:NTP pyrophosphatase (non-canonical NTP hydrolase)
MTKTMKELAEEIHETAVEKGFWEGGSRNFLEALMLIVSEAAEACEAYRKQQNDKIPDELADIMIRTMDLAEGFGIDIQDAVVKKMEFNRTRPYKHGKIA